MHHANKYGRVKGKMKLLLNGVHYFIKILGFQCMTDISN
jgi:hypothetical protein